MPSPENEERPPAANQGGGKNLNQGLTLHREHYKAAEKLLAAWEAERGEHPNAHTRNLLAAVAHALLAVADEVDTKYVGGTW